MLVPVDYFFNSDILAPPIEYIGRGGERMRSFLFRAAELTSERPEQASPPLPDSWARTVPDSALGLGSGSICTF